MSALAPAPQPTPLSPPAQALKAAIRASNEILAKQEIAETALNAAEGAAANAQRHNDTPKNIAALQVVAATARAALDALNRLAQPIATTLDKAMGWNGGAYLEELTAAERIDEKARVAALMARFKAHIARYNASVAAAAKPIH